MSKKLAKTPKRRRKAATPTVRPKPRPRRSKAKGGTNARTIGKGLRIREKPGKASQVRRRKRSKHRSTKKRQTRRTKQKAIRRVLLYSGGREITIVVRKHTASTIGRYMAHVRWFLQTNDLAHLEPFASKSVKDIRGERHPLETRPNVLHRLANSGGSTFEQIYRIVI